MLIMDSLCNKVAVRSRNIAPHLGKDGNVKPVGLDHSLIDLSYLVANLEYINRFLARLIGDTDTARKVNEFNIYIEIFFHFQRQAENFLGKAGIIIFFKTTTCKHGVNAEMLDPLFFKGLKGKFYLVIGHTEL